MRLPRRTVSRIPRPSPGELLFGEQLRQAGISFTREHLFEDSRDFRADFFIPPDILLEIEGGIWTQGRHTRGLGFTSGCEAIFRYPSRLSLHPRPDRAGRRRHRVDLDSVIA